MLHERPGVCREMLSLHHPQHSTTAADETTVAKLIVAAQTHDNQKLRKDASSIESR